MTEYSEPRVCGLHISTYIWKVNIIIYKYSITVYIYAKHHQFKENRPLEEIKVTVTIRVDKVIC